MSQDKYKQIHLPKLKNSRISTQKEQKSQQTRHILNKTKKCHSQFPKNCKIFVPKPKKSQILTENIQILAQKS
jgi:hypothetical protein